VDHDRSWRARCGAGFDPRSCDAGGHGSVDGGREYKPPPVTTRWSAITAKAYRQGPPDAITTAYRRPEHRIRLSRRCSPRRRVPIESLPTEPAEGRPARWPVIPTEAMALAVEGPGDASGDGARAEPSSLEEAGPVIRRLPVDRTARLFEVLGSAG